MSDTDLLEEIKDRFSQCSSYYSSEYERGREDTRFLYGYQWDEADRKAREGRPCLVENRLLPFKHQVLNSIKQADLSIKVAPVDDKADVATAQILQGIIRNIEVTSGAEVAYDTAADKAIDFGRGFIHITTKYVDDMSFDKEIVIERIINPSSVYIDPNSIKLDGSDAEYAFIFDEMTVEEFERLYPKANAVSFTSVNADDNDWCTKERIRVAGYYYKHYTRRSISLLANGEVVYTDKVPAGSEIIETRTTDVCTVKWAKTNGQDILEKTDIESYYIPIVPVYGEETWIDGQRRVYSLIHQAKDPQRILNYWRSANTELMALQPKAPYIGPVGAFESKRNQWVNANNRNPAFLEYDPIETENGTVLPPPAREQPPQGSQSMFQEATASAEAIKAVLGMFDASLGNHGNEISGVAIRERKLQGDNANFHFIDNLGISIEQVGRILVSMIPKVMNKKQIARIIGADGTPELVPVNQPYLKTDDGLVPYNGQADKYDGIYDLSVGKYDVVVEVGPNYATKRQELVAALSQIGSAVPEIYAVAGDILVRNLDIPDSEELARRIQSTMDPVLLSDDPQAAKLQEATQAVEQLKEQLISMQLKLDEKVNDQMQKNELEARKLELDAQKNDIDRMKAEAEVEKTRAEIAKIASEAAPTPEIMAEVAQVLNETLERIDQNETTLELIVSAKEREATPQPKGFLSRLMGRNA